MFRSDSPYIPACLMVAVFAAVIATASYEDSAAFVVALICAAYHVGTVERQSSYEAQIAQQSATIRAYVAYLAKTQPEKFTITRESSR